MYEYGVSFKSVRHLQEYGRFHFYSRYVIVFKQWREVLGAHGLSGHSAKRRNPILHAVSPVSQNLYVESLNQFYIFLASFGQSACFRNPFGKLSHLRAKYGKSPQKFLSIFTLRQHKFSPNVLIWSKYLSIMETTGWYLSIDMCFVWVHCSNSRQCRMTNENQCVTFEFVCFFQYLLKLVFTTPIQIVSKLYLVDF